MRCGAARLAVALVVAFALGCGEEAPASTPDEALHASPADPAPPSLDDATAFTVALRELAEAEAAWGRALERDVGTAEGVRGARERARLAQIVARRAPRESEASREALERARVALEEGARRRTLSGACDAALALARLLARELDRPEDAYRVAYRAARRFPAPDDARCAAEARRLLAVLERARPDAASLAAIDADPDRDDPSVGLGEASASPGGSPSTAASSASETEAIEAWARERRVEGAPVRLEGLSAFGERGAETARVVLLFDCVAAFRADELPADEALPRRLSLTLPGTTVVEALPTVTPVEAAGLLRVRWTADGADTRVVLDLTPDAEAHTVALPDPFRVVIDVWEPAAATAPAERRALDLVVLDPGHGGEDYGTRAFGLEEADLALDLAVRVRDALLAARPRLRVVLTREDDAFVSLEQRTAMANAIGADAFVSIHLNGVREDVEHGGVTTFLLDNSSDAAALRLAAAENGTGTGEVGALERVLAGLLRAEQVEASRLLAQRVHASLLAGGRTMLPRLFDRGVRTAMFHVLVGARMPAVLVEAAFMTREDEARALETDAYRAALARGIAEGILAWGG